MAINMERILIIVISVLYFSSCNEEPTMQIISNGDYLDSIYVDDKGRANGLAKYYFKGNLYKEVQYTNGKKNGLNRQYSFRDSLIQEFLYENDSLISERKLTTNGRLIYEFNYGYIDSSSISIKKWFYSNGKLEQRDVFIHLINIIAHEEYYPNGNKKITGYYSLYKDGELPIIDWISDVHSVGFISQGLKNGQWCYYNEDGIVEQIKSYYSGVLVCDSTVMSRTSN